jgi:hypothetical protein
VAPAPELAGPAAPAPVDVEPRPSKSVTSEQLITVTARETVAATKYLEGSRGLTHHLHV